MNKVAYSTNASHRMADVQLSDLQYENQGYRTGKMKQIRTISKSHNKSLPKTAVNFHKMKKGLYLNSNRKDLQEFCQKQQKLLSAYNVHYEDPNAANFSANDAFDNNNDGGSMQE